MVCTTFTRAYLAHLFRSEELLGPRLLSYHNLAALASLMADARTALAEGRWTAFRDGVLGEAMAAS
jgi:queuine tRNA-ribosyltransferase